MKKILCLSLACLFAQIGTTHAQTKVNIQSADSFFNSQLKDGRFNGNVLLAENGKVLYKKSFGLANQKTKAALNDNSMFELASCSKQFTAMSIALLQHQGKLKVSDDFTKYIPELSFYKGITINDLIHHISGLDDYMSLDSLWKDWDDQKIATDKDVIAGFAKYKPALLFETGTKYEYSNTGYMLLATIVARVSGMSFGDYLQQNIFKPLKMERSMVYNRRYAPKKVSNYAFGYVMNDSLNKLVLPDDYMYTSYVYNMDGISGDGAVNSTVNDLLKWNEALYTDKLLPEAERKAIFEPGTLKDGTAVNYGYGWALKNTKDGLIASHSGGWPGYITYIERNHKTHQTIIMLQNGPGGIPVKESRLLLEGKAIPPSEFKEMKISETALEQYVGEYQLLPEMTLTVTREGDKLFGHPSGQNRIQFYPYAEDKFFIKDIDAHMEYNKEEGKVTGLTWHQAGRSMKAPKIK